MDLRRLLTQVEHKNRMASASLFTGEQVLLDAPRRPLEVCAVPPRHVAHCDLSGALTLRRARLSAPNKAEPREWTTTYPFVSALEHSPPLDALLTVEAPRGGSSALAVCRVYFGAAAEAETADGPLSVMALPTASGLGCRAVAADQTEPAVAVACGAGSIAIWRRSYRRV